MNVWFSFLKGESIITLNFKYIGKATRCTYYAIRQHTINIVEQTKILSESLWKRPVITLKANHSSACSKNCELVKRCCYHLQDPRWQPSCFTQVRMIKCDFTQISVDNIKQNMDGKLILFSIGDHFCTVSGFLKEMNLMCKA